MQELIEKILEWREATGSASDLVHIIQTAFPPATIHPSQFVNGEPLEDGEYVVKTKSGKHAIVSWYDRQWICAQPQLIISHAKLPE